MGDWTETRQMLAQLVERLQPEDALAIIKTLVRKDEEDLVSTLSSLIRGHVAGGDKEQEQGQNDS
jgi:hypothetical protein